MPKLKPIIVHHEKFFISYSFDICDFIGDGIWWLQVYDDCKNIIYDEPFASSRGDLDIKKVKDIIIKNFFISGFN